MIDLIFIGFILVIFCYLNMGLCPSPQFLFCLETKKESKKVKAAPASLEKLAFDGYPSADGLNSPAAQTVSQLAD